MPSWGQVLDSDSRHQELLASLGRSDVDLSGAVSGVWPLLTAWLADHWQGVVVVLCAQPHQLASEVRGWLDGNPQVVEFPGWDCEALDFRRPSAPVRQQRLSALELLAESERLVVVSTLRAVIEPTIAPQDLSQRRLRLALGSKADPMELARALAAMGYQRELVVGQPGDFALRGGILDLFALTASFPMRVEFSGNEVVSLRGFDLISQRSSLPVSELMVGPAAEAVGEAESMRRFAARLGAELDLPGHLRADVGESWQERLALLAEGGQPSGLESLAAHLWPQRACLADHLPQGSLVVWLQLSAQTRWVHDYLGETHMLARAEVDQGELPEGLRLALLAPEEVHSRLARFRTMTVDGGVVEAGWDLGWATPENIVGCSGGLVEGLRGHLAGGQKHLVLCTDQEERVAAVLTEADFPYHRSDLGLTANIGPGLNLISQDLVSGAVHHQSGLEILTDSELFGRLPKAGRPRVPGSRQVQIGLDYEPGDLVVHVDHGIGRFKGMRLVEGEGGSREYLELEYAAGDRLLVPAEFLDRVQKYLGSGESTPPLHRLGAGDWTRAKSRARKAVQDIAEELIKIHAARQLEAGHAFAADTPWQAELEASFPYQETSDQIATMAEIKTDMESPTPMDRLICGDVGFGKTELALRAAFKAATDGKQVAMVVPTTVLAQQHLEYFSRRLGAFPVRVDMLSRFRTSEEQQRIIGDLRTGQIDIVIGTHRLLQRDVRFKHLGLVVLDEEHRFGVVQKERLKKLRAQVDVLSLSATPIPRTLNMSLSGVRELSVIRTPPEDRLPVRTYVTVDDDELTRGALHRELERGGQAYFVHNRVRSIQRQAQRLRKLLPQARIAVGHGQMAEQDLAQVMTDFSAGEYDILVCTTIIESGLDIPNANTIIIHQADRFGLAQLYQLRGRVGRSGRRAYAYLLYDPQRSLSEAADKRLEAIEALHELGSGFNLALRDLEIRGAGNLLGTEQHGAIAAIGFEMYSHMLSRAVEQLRGSGATADPVEDLPEMVLDVGLPHYIPKSYIREEALRLDAYRELAYVRDQGELDSRVRSLTDRYGSIPAAVEDLLYCLKVKLIGQELRIRSIVVQGGWLTIRVDPDAYLDVASLERQFGDKLQVHPNRLRLAHGEQWREHLLRVLRAMRELSRLPVSV